MIDIVVMNMVMWNYQCEGWVFIWVVLFIVFLCYFFWWIDEFVGQEIWGMVILLLNDVVVFVLDFDMFLVLIDVWFLDNFF